MEKQEIISRLTGIWKEPEFSEFTHNTALVDGAPLDNPILFLGINPSIGRNQTHAWKYNKDPVQEYQLNHKQPHHAYFKRFKEIGIHCNSRWSHWDLLFFRETDQSKVNSICKQPTGRMFLEGQLKITYKVLTSLRPKVIVCCNTLARKLMEQPSDKYPGMGFEFEFDTGIGTHRISNTGLRGMPIFFTSMLMGQRALDNGSFERLKWHIKWILNTDD